MASSDQEYVQTLRKLGFEPVQDLGSFAWVPSKCERKSIQACTKEDVLEATVFDPEIPQISDLRQLNLHRLPQVFATEALPPQIKPQAFPHVTPRVLGLFLAKTKGIDLDKVDFSFGGSTLEVLLKRDISNVSYGPRGVRIPQEDYCYRVQKVAGVICVSKCDNYVKDYSDSGFQFERLVTGGEFRDRHDESHNGTEHVQLLEFCGRETNDHVSGVDGADFCPFQILFTTDADAKTGKNAAGKKDERDDLVEIKSGNPANFGRKLVLQMLSSGARQLVYADKRSRNEVSQVKTLYYPDVVCRFLRAGEKQGMVTDLSAALTELREAAADIPDCLYGSEGECVAFDLTFDTRDPKKPMRLVPAKKYADCSLSPKEVLRGLLED
ncbi:unnamed protein product [Amoebophrya sp. A120]|nr:unnamed protein product [Amoebophrya sp. A120]|eukprot:GSA120T00016601001.1